MEKAYEDEMNGKTWPTIRILLIFAKDGTEEAENIVTGMINFTIPGTTMRTMMNSRVTSMTLRM